MQSQNENPHLDLGVRIGHGQAFGALANKCAEAQAECLRAVRDSAQYKLLGLTWEQYCNQHAGLSRANADKLIQNLNEFGEMYFRLSSMVRISPETYRQVAPRVAGAEIEIGGQKVAVIPENAERIRKAIVQLRASQPKPPQPAPPQKDLLSAAALSDRFDDFVSALERGIELGRENLSFGRLLREIGHTLEYLYSHFPQLKIDR